MNQQDWESRYPQIEKTYIGRQINRIPVSCDVRTFINGQDCVVRKIAAAVFGEVVLSSNTLALPDEVKLERVQKFVIDRLKYTGDQKQVGYPEFWLYPWETWASKLGDCEDGAMLIHSLLLACGIESWRLRTTAGYVKAGPTAEGGGHAYVTYCRGEDWVPIDWCYLPEVKKTLAERTSIKNRPEYREVWFSFNERACWSHMNLPWMTGRLHSYRDFVQAKCAVCGCEHNLQVHHVISQTILEKLGLKELVNDPRNLVTLCACPEHQCHLRFGHLGDYGRTNIYLPWMLDRESDSVVSL